jgi:hypothetical protein
MLYFARRATDTLEIELPAAFLSLFSKIWSSFCLLMWGIFAGLQIKAALQSIKIKVILGVSYGKFGVFRKRDAGQKPLG